MCNKSDIVIEVEINGLWFEIETRTNEAKVIKYKNKNEYNGNIVIPLTVEYNGVTCLVTRIDDSAFYDCRNITSIEIPISVTSIGDLAFSGCHSLTSISLPDRVTCIGVLAFRGCYSLTSINIPDNVTCIQAGTFRSCGGLTSITIPNNVTRIDGYAFLDCRRLTSVTIGEKVSEISYCAFANCGKLINVVCLADNVPNTRNDAFRDSGIESASLHVPDATVNSYKNAEPWINFKKIISKSEERENIEVEIDNLWYEISTKRSEAKVIKYKNNNKYNGNIVIPFIVEYDGVVCYVTSIGMRAFSRCEDLTSVTIPESVTYIDAYAFEYCDQLASIKIPQNVSKIGRNAFSFCRELRSFKIPRNIKSIECETFCGCISLSSITIPNSIVDIKSGAFLSCFGLTSITIPNSVIIIGSSAFSSCKTLSSVTIGEKVSNIYWHAFAECAKLTDVFCLAKDVPSTSEDAFEDSFPEGITLHVPIVSVDAYKAEITWGHFKDVVDL